MTILDSQTTTRIRILPERWRYNIGLITTSTLIAQLLTAVNGQPIEPIEGMGEVKAEIRSYEAKVSELKTENKRLNKEVERLERGRNAGATSARNKHGSQSGSGGVNNGNSSDSHSLNVEATAYTARCSGCTGITASGYDVRSTIYTPEGLRVLAAPKSIPFHTKMRVTLADGTSFVGEVLDRGGAIGPGKLDILVGDEATAYKLGRQAATVEILR